MSHDTANSQEPVVPAVPKKNLVGPQPTPTSAPAPAAGALTEWHDMTPGEQFVAWHQLRAWVTWLIDHYELTVDDRLPRCWASHPGLVEELRALWKWRLEIYSGAQPAAGQAARYWHAELDRVLTLAGTRYAAGCRAGHRGAIGLVAVDDGLQERWASANLLAGVPPVDICGGHAKHAGNWVSAEAMAAAYDAGYAGRAEGQRDYLQYEGRWWVAGAGGWIPVPAPAVPGQVNGARPEIRDD